MRPILRPMSVTAVTAVIGTGTWGTAVAVMAARTGLPVTLFGRDAHKIANMRATLRHPEMPDLPLPDTICFTANHADLAAADLILWAVPTQFTREQARLLRSALPPQVGVVSLSKGLEQGSMERVSQVLASELGDRPYGCLSGPSHAQEVIAGLPVCLVVAGSERLCLLTQERLLSTRSRLYSSTDVIGVELAGALKNVIAVGAGICEGLKLGDNTKSAVITRGLAEMRRLGRALGAQDATFAGLAGVGDLLASCYSPHGRNRALGLALARGAEAQTYLRSQKTVAEGAWTCRVAVELAKRSGIELPIASQVANVIWAATPVPTAMENLLSRAPKEEDA